MAIHLKWLAINWMIFTKSLPWKNGWKSPFPSIKKWVVWHLEFQDYQETVEKTRKNSPMEIDCFEKYGLMNN